MATTKQIEANRSNARKSTGPRSETGKGVSSRNAVTHGLTAEKHLLNGEDLEDFGQLRTSLTAEYKPATVLEMALVDRLGSLLWRHRRVPVFEAAVFSRLALSLSTGEVPETRATEGNSGKRGRPPKSVPIAAARFDIGHAIEVALSGNYLEKISRYDTAVMSQVLKTEEYLSQLIGMRRQAEYLKKPAESAPRPAPKSNDPLDEIRWP